MLISKIEGQLVSWQEHTFGMGLKTALEAHRIQSIDAGTIMVAKFNEAVQYLFEVSFDIKVEKLKGASPMYPMQGSRLPLRVLPAGVTEKMVKSKTVLFRDCRLPTPLEYDKYLNAITV